MFTELGEKMLRKMGMLFISCMAYGMEKKEDTNFSILPRDACALIAGKASLGSALEYKETDRRWWAEFCRMSSTWNDLVITQEDIFQHQLWYRPSPDLGAPRFRFDNDKTHDCNEFMCTDLDKKAIMAPTRYDGPNHDEGPDNGVIMVGTTYARDLCPWNPLVDSVFYLFKLHGIASKDYKGPQPIKKTDRAGNCALVYENFPFVSPVYTGESVDYCAIAPKNKIALATFAGPERKEGILRIFNYAVAYNDQNRLLPEQTFTVNEEVCHKDTPLFKKLCWLYGRTLLGVTHNNELYVVAHNANTVNFYEQKIPLKIKDIAVHRPENDHRIILCDDQDSLYFANLKERDPNGALIYRCIYKNNPGVAPKSVPLQETMKIKNAIDRLWFYNNKIGTMELSSSARTFFGFKIKPEDVNVGYTIECA